MSIKLLFVATILTNNLTYPVDAGVYDNILHAATHYSMSGTNQLFINLFTHFSTTARSDKYSNITGSAILGHSFLQITNCYNEPVFFQGFQINKNKSITVGLWGTKGGDPMPNDEVGIFINREAFYYSNLEYVNNSHMLMASTTKEKLYDTFDFIREKAFIYDAISYNCTNFATDLWFKLVGQRLECGLPSTLMAAMDEQDEYSCVEGRTVSFSTDCFYSYHKTAVRFKKYSIGG